MSFPPIRLVPIVLVALAACSLLFSGCASAEKKQDGEDDRVSTLPWNRPEKWEKSVNMGGGVNY
jgi:uncharacterized protein YceK